MHHLEFEEYRPLIAFYAVDTNFNRFEYFSDQAFAHPEYEPDGGYDDDDDDDCDTPTYRMVLNLEKSLMFNVCHGCAWSDDLVFNYRDFHVFVEAHNCIYIGYTPDDIGWRCFLPIYQYITAEELRSVAIEFIDAWHRSKVSPGQLAIPGVCA
ncbi:MAG TPA: hypothetical protein V6D12_13765 [Candidatus Obscuribacterales bacterium]